MENNTSNNDNNDDNNNIINDNNNDSNNNNQYNIDDIQQNLSSLITISKQHEAEKIYMEKIVDPFMNDTLTLKNLKLTKGMCVWARVDVFAAAGIHCKQQAKAHPTMSSKHPKTLLLNPGDKASLALASFSFSTVLSLVDFLSVSGCSVIIFFAGSCMRVMCRCMYMYYV